MAIALMLTPAIVAAIISTDIHARASSTLRWAGWESFDDEPRQHAWGRRPLAERGHFLAKSFRVMKRKPLARARAFGVVPVTHVTVGVSPPLATK